MGRIGVLTARSAHSTQTVVLHDRFGTCIIYNVVLCSERARQACPSILRRDVLVTSASGKGVA